MRFRVVGLRTNRSLELFLGVIQFATFKIDSAESIVRLRRFWIGSQSC